MADRLSREVGDICPLPSRLRIARNILRQAIGSSGCFHRFSSSTVTSQPDDRRVLAGEWEYVDDAVVLLTLDEQGNGHYDWKEGRFETRTLIGHTWHGMWFQKENGREGGFTVELSPDFSEGEGRWWYSRIGTDHTITQKGGTFHLKKKTARMNRSVTQPAQ